MIQLHDKPELCLALSSVRDIELKNCELMDETQWFNAGQGNFKNYRFELITINGKVVTQHHHPRSGESVYAKEG